MRHVKQAVASGLTSDGTVMHAWLSQQQAWYDADDDDERLGNTGACIDRHRLRDSEPVMMMMMMMLTFAAGFHVADQLP